MITVFGVNLGARLVKNVLVIYHQEEVCSQTRSLDLSGMSSGNVLLSMGCKLSKEEHGSHHS